MGKILASVFQKRMMQSDIIHKLLHRELGTDMLLLLFQKMNA